jgi:hypothetical protein
VDSSDNLQGGQVLATKYVWTCTHDWTDVKGPTHEELANSIVTHFKEMHNADIPRPEAERLAEMGSKKVEE